MIYFHPGPVLDRKLQGNCFEDSRTLPGAVWSGITVAWDRLIRKEKLIVFQQLGIVPIRVCSFRESHQNTPQSTGVF